MKKSVRLPAFAKINLCLHVLGTPSGRLSRAPDDFSSDLAARHAGTFAHSSRDLFWKRTIPHLPIGPENLVYRAIEAIRTRDRVSRRHSRASGKAHSCGARAGRRVQRRRRRADRRVATDKKEGAAGTADGDRRRSGRGRAVFSFRWPRAGGESRRRNLSSAGRAQAHDPGGFAAATSASAPRTPISGFPQELTNRPKPPNIWGFCALCWSRPGRGSRMISRSPSSTAIRDSEKSGTGLLKRGAADAALAGSGSAVFGVFRNPAQARRAARAFPEDSVFVVETLSREKYGHALGGVSPSLR